MSQSNKPTGESKPQPVLMKNPLGESGMRKFSCIPPRYAKTQGVNLGLEFVWSTIEAMATISDLHKI
ncbi:hypothetical protein ACT497_001286 [Salmonella enterica subsp. enterica serovar Glostrup]|nr:hypothetical protein [Salmonella enterica]